MLLDLVFRSVVVAVMILVKESLPSSFSETLRESVALKRAWLACEVFVDHFDCTGTKVTKFSPNLYNKCTPPL